MTFACTHTQTVTSLAGHIWAPSAVLLPAFNSHHNSCSTSTIHRPALGLYMLQAYAEAVSLQQIFVSLHVFRFVLSSHQHSCS